MADGTTTNLGLTLPEVGASTDSWGRKLNDDLIFLDNVFSRADPATTVTLLINNQEIETTNSYTLSTVLLGDDRQLQFGAAPDYHLIYNATDTRLELNTADNGSGAGTVFKVEDGADTVDFTGKVTAASLTLASPATNVTGISTDTSLGSSDALLATQGAVKTYVDAQVGSFDTLAEVLAAGNTTESTDIVVTAGQKITTDTILETTTDAGVTIDSVVLKDGAIATGTWNGNVIQATYGGSGLVGAADGTIAIADGSGAPTTLDVGSSTGITIVGALNAGSITSGFTSIDVGDGAITTTGTVSATTLAGTLSTATQNSVTTATGLVTVGTITSGIWASTDVAVAHGGTGASSAAAAATNLGLGTGDSPQFTAVNVGGASDTTLSRKSAGVLQVESSELYVQGGTDVAVADGGTALSSYAAGDIIYASGTTTLAKLAKGSDTQVLTLALGVPTWASPTVGDITEIVAGAGLTGTSLSGPIPTLNVIGTSGTITVSADAVTIASDYVGQTSITTVGDLDAGSITSGFGAINNGASDITTTGTVSATTLTGTLSTEAQTNITSVGTLTSLALSGNITMADDTSIGISDSDERIEFDGAGDISVLGANFGIGTDAPGAPLHIYKDLAAPDDLGDFDNYHLVVQNATDTGKAAGILLTTSANEYGGSAIVHYDTGSNGIGDLAFYTKQSTSAEPPVEVMRLDESGSVGIGDSDPQDHLEVRGTGVGKGITVSSTTATGANLSFARDSTATARIQLTEPAALHTGDLRFYTSDASGGPNLLEAMRMTQGQDVNIPNGGLAIGTTSSPTGLLNLESAGDTFLQFELTGTGANVWNVGMDNNDGAFKIIDGAAGATPALTIDTSGNVGIGTTAPTNALTVKGATDKWIWCDTISTGEIGFQTQNDAGDAYVAFGINALTQTFNTGSNPRLFIANDGDIGIGTTSPAEQVHIKNWQNDDTKLVIDNQLGTGTRSAAGAVLSIAAEAGSYDPKITFGLGGGGADWAMGIDNSDSDKFKISGGTDVTPALETNPRLTIDGSGNVGIGNTSPSSQYTTRLVVGDGAGMEGITIYSGADAKGRLEFSDGTTGAATYAGGIQYDHTGDYMRFTSNVSERMRITSAGDLAINATNKIYLDGSAGTGHTYIVESEADRLDLYAGGQVALSMYESANEVRSVFNYGTTAIWPAAGLGVRWVAANEYAATFWHNGNATTGLGVTINCGTDNASGTNTAMSFKDGDGSDQGSITFTDGTTSYNAFTAGHDASLPDGEETGYAYGTLVEIVEIYYKERKDGSEMERGILYKVQKSQSAYAKNVLGAYSSQYEESVVGDDNLHQVYCLGDGHIICNGENGDIEVGDGICTSSTEGEGMKADQLSMIIGIAQEDTSFSSASETKLVPVQYGLRQFQPWE